MKKNNFLRRFLFPAVIAVTSLVLVSCDKDDDLEDDPNQDRTYVLSGSASGNQEIPIVTTTATGTLTGTYVSAINTLTYNITWTGLSGNVTAMHFHGPATSSQEAGPIHSLTISSNGTAGTSTGTLILADSTEQHLLAGKIYYNIHTALNPDGEIRGQVTATAN
ncbi:MAG TPA: CHRD domain-containing protein [Chitinophagaceae bacterium]|jgi:hypothetical protein|nr:CHRD domain-containing protein [Chitinophagaceae bacterium]